MQPQRGGRPRRAAQPRQPRAAQLTPLQRQQRAFNSFKVRSSFRLSPDVLSQVVDMLRGRCQGHQAAPVAVALHQRRASCAQHLLVCNPGHGPVCDRVCLTVSMLLLLPCPATTICIAGCKVTCCRCIQLQHACSLVSDLCCAACTASVCSLCCELHAFPYPRSRT